MAATWTAIGLLTTILLGLFVYLGSKIDGLGTSLAARIDALNHDLGARIDALDARLSARIDGLSTRIDEMSARLADHVGNHRHAG